MKSKTASALFLTVILAIGVAIGQMGPPRATGGKGSPHYDKATEMSVKGIVEDVTPAPVEKNRWAQIHLTLKSGTDTYHVHVGPLAYISSQQFSFAAGDTIEVVGSSIKTDGQNTLLARQITKDGKVLTLRDEQGFPRFAHRERQSSHSHDD